MKRGWKSIAAGAAVLLAAAGCSVSVGGEKNVSAEELGTKISAALHEKFPDVAAPTVTCPEALPAKEGSVVTCQLTIDGQDYDVTATSTGLNDDGKTVGFDYKVVDASK